MTLEFVQYLASCFVGGASIYAAIKADLARAIVIVKAEHAAEAAKLAHGRIDLHIERHH